MGIAHRHDELSVLHDQRHDAQARREARAHQAHGRALGTVERVARGDGNAELQAQVDRQGVGIEQAHLHEDGAETTAHPGLLCHRRVDLGLREAPISQQHRAQSHCSAAYHVACHTGHPQPVQFRRFISEFRRLGRVWLLTLVGAGWALGCADSGQERSPDPAADAASLSDDAGQTVPAEPVPRVPLPYGPEVKSLRLKRSTIVYLFASDAAKKVGTIAADIRVGFRSAASGPGCEKLWIEIEPRGWICERYLEPSDKPPAGVELPKLKKDEIVPGTYGKVVASGARVYPTLADLKAGRSTRGLSGMVTVRKYAETRVGGRTYWKTSWGGDFIDAKKISPHEPSRFVGVRLDEPASPALPFAWAQSRKRQVEPVLVRAAPNDKAAVVRKLVARTVVPILGTDEQVLDVEDAGTATVPAKFARIGDGEWVALADLHLARLSDPPPLTRADERWFDVDLDEQVRRRLRGRAPRVHDDDGVGQQEVADGDRASTASGSSSPRPT